MKNFLMVAGVCIVVLFAVDALWFNGQYFVGANDMMSNIFRHFR